MGLMDGKRGLITGVFNNMSIAWAIADKVMAEGGECGFTYMPDKPDDERQKNRGRLEKLIKDRAQAKFMVPMDVTSDDDIKNAMATTAQNFGKIDFLLHSIAFAPPEDLRRETISTSRDGFKLAMEISAYSLLALAREARDSGVLADNGSIVTLTYFGGEKAVPGYNVMGVCKAALDSCVKYLAYDLGPRGVRVNAISAGPLKTISMRGVGDPDGMLKLYESIAPLQRNVTHEEVGRIGMFLLSDLSNGITGEIMHVDGGYSIMGSPGRMIEKYRDQVDAPAGSEG